MHAHNILISDTVQPLMDPSSSHPLVPVEVPKDELISSLKALVLSKLGMKNEGSHMHAVSLYWHDKGCHNLLRLPYRMV